MVSLEKDTIDHKCRVEFILWGQLMVDQLTDQRTDVTIHVTTQLAWLKHTQQM